MPPIRTAASSMPSRIPCHVSGKDLERVCETDASTAAQPDTQRPPSSGCRQSFAIRTCSSW